MIDSLATFISKCILLSYNLYHWLQRWRREHYSYKFTWYQGRPYLDFFSLDVHIAILEENLRRYQKILTLDLWLQLLFTELKKIPQTLYVVIGPSQRFFIQFMIDDGQYIFCLADWKTNDNKRMRRSFLRLLRDEGFTQVSARQRYTDFGKYHFLITKQAGNTDIFANVGQDPQQLADFMQKIIEGCMNRSLKSLKLQIIA